MRNAGLEEAEAWIKISGRIINDLSYADDSTVMAESEDVLMKVKEASEKAGLKLNIQKTKIMSSSPITSWQVDVETAADLIFFWLQNHCRWWLQPWNKKRLLGREVMTNLDSILKSRGISLPTKVHLVKATFPVVMYGCESWTIKKAQCRRIDAFELWCWRTLESPLDCKEIWPVHPKGNQSWMSNWMTDVEAETPTLWSLDVKNWLIWKDPDTGKD